MISVLIPTYKRDEKLLQCCRSLLANSLEDTNIYILDQNKTLSTELKRFIASHPSHLHYLKTNTHNKSVALNKAILLAKGDILAFTDDDCIVSPTWIHRIREDFLLHPDIACVTGNTVPYRSVKPNLCPTLFKSKTKIIRLPQKHTGVGYGNNFAIRKSALQSLGLFKEWLGPGSIGFSCEDGEIILRLLTNKHNILHDEHMLVYHNKKLNEKTYTSQQCAYICGEVACYSYYALFGWKFASRVLQRNGIDSYREIKKFLGDMIKRKILRSDRLLFMAQRQYARLKGLLVGLYFYVRKRYAS